MLNFWFYLFQLICQKWLTSLHVNRDVNLEEIVIILEKEIVSLSLRDTDTSYIPQHDL